MSLSCSKYCSNPFTWTLGDKLTAKDSKVRFVLSCAPFTGTIMLCINLFSRLKNPVIVALGETEKKHSRTQASQAREAKKSKKKSVESNTIEFSKPIQLDKYQARFKTYCSYSAVSHFTAAALLIVGIAKGALALTTASAGGVVVAGAFGVGSLLVRTFMKPPLPEKRKSETPAEEADKKQKSAEDAANGTATVEKPAKDPTADTHSNGKATNGSDAAPGSKKND